MIIATSTRRLRSSMLALLLATISPAIWAADSAFCGTAGAAPQPFRQQPDAVSLMSRTVLEQAAVILGIEGGRRLGSVGDAVFARNVPAAAGGRYTLVRPGPALPASARGTQSPGVVIMQVGNAVAERCRDGLMLLRIVDSVREVRVGDRLAPGAVAAGAP